jgi:hypothetical protein
MASVVTPTGVIVPTFQEIANDLAADQNANVDPNLLTAVQNGDGVSPNLNATFVNAISEAYDSIATLADALDREKAEFERLDVVGSLSGTTRNVATKSAFTGTHRISVNLNAGVTLPAGSQFSVIDHPEFLYETLTDVTNSGGSPADEGVEAKALATGPTPGNSGTATVIRTPVVGWNSVTNPTDVILGKNVEVDQPYRVRQVNELRGGSAATDAIRSALLKMKDSDDPSVQPIIEAFVIANDQDFTVNNVPPHGIEAVIWDGPGAIAKVADVAQVLFTQTDPGSVLVGSLIHLVTDSYGFQRTIRFSRPTQRTVSIRATYTYDATGYAGDAAAKAAIAASFQSGLDANGKAVNDSKQRPAKNVDFSPYMSVLQSVQGVKSITLWEMHLDGSGFSSWTPLSIALREIGVTDTSQITIISTPG